MKILICSDGMPASTQATRLGGIVAAACKVDTVVLGIAERSADEGPLRQAIEEEIRSLQTGGVSAEIKIRAGEPIREILKETSDADYDLVVIGAQRKGSSGLYWRSEKTYEVIKAIASPVLVAIGDRAQLKRILVCSGGKEFIDEPLRLTSKLAAGLGAAVTLLHVMAEPPAMYADLVELEEDLDRLLQSKSELGVNLRRQKEALEKLGIETTVRIRHGIVLDQIFREVRRSEPDLIVTGSSAARGTLRHYIMGDVTRSILNRANFPVLVARSLRGQPGGFWRWCKQAFSGSQQ